MPPKGRRQFLILERLLILPPIQPRGTVVQPECIPIFDERLFVAIGDFVQAVTTLTWRLGQCLGTVIIIVLLLIFSFLRLTALVVVIVSAMAAGQIILMLTLAARLIATVLGMMALLLVAVGFGASSDHDECKNTRRCDYSEQHHHISSPNSCSPAAHTPFEQRACYGTMLRCQDGHPEHRLGKTTS